MKSRRLTETDLANLSFKHDDVKRKALIAIEKPKQIVGSYEPFRSHCGDALNEQYPLLDERRPPTSLEDLEGVIARACKGDVDKLSMNIPIAKATHTYATECGVEAVREDIRRLVMPFGHSYEFGMPMLMIYPNKRVAAVFSDLRRTQPLTGSGRRFVWSAMHHRWRENYPDLAHIDTEIWRYANNEDRVVRAFPSTEQDLIPYDSIIADVRQTYAIWHQVLSEAATGRRGRDDDAGPLFAQRNL